MKKHMYGVGAVALALAMSGLPAIVLAEGNGNTEGQQDGAQVTAQVNASVGNQESGVVSSDAEDGSETDQASSTEEVQDDAEWAQEATQRAAEKAQEGARHAAEKTLEMMKEGVPFLLESTTTSAMSFKQLKRLIEQRKEELDQEEASSSPETHDIMKNANPVRLAVHSLLVSKDLLGGIGSQVSEIAKHMNDSVATTTKAEAQIKSRGFFARLFFGGDATSADVIAYEAAQNQRRIDELSALLGQASTTVAVKATLSEQITALKDAQARLQDIAQKEKSAWGLFSWRF
ncbi:MAG: hypothetical protein WCW36_01745 [Candidatus Paceibacterota bacterium]